MSSRGPKSIQKKLVASSLKMQAGALLGFLAAVIWINASLAARQKEQAVASIGNSLLAKGRILVSNNAQALREMVPENAFLAVANLVQSTVRDDEDVIYGIFMDAERRPWVRADSANPEGLVADPSALGDSLSLWAAGVAEASHRRIGAAGGGAVEFAAPVVVDGMALGVIRYGLSTAGMESAIAAASRSARHALARTIGAVALFGCAVLLLSFLAARKQARRITRPIEELQIAANAIAGGDYGSAVAVSSDDEIGLLASDFDTMRITVKEYTDRLREMVAEKVQEVKDILDNIEQGLFTVGLDGKVNPDYALSTNAILAVEDAARCGLGGLLRLDAAREREWQEWLDLVKVRHASQRWEKLVRLCPVREIRLPGPGGGERIILVGYQKMFDSQKRLHKLMVLVHDVTEARRAEAAILKEKQRHEDEVKAILGIVRYAAFIPDFMEDANGRLRRLADAVRRAPLLSGPAAAEPARELARELHTLKGTSATYGFAAVSRLALEAEMELANLRSGSPDSQAGGWGEIAGLLDRMGAALEDIRALGASLSGKEPDRSISIARPRIRELRALTAQAAIGGPEALARLLRACRSIDHIPLEQLAEKYRVMLQGLGERLGKRIEFQAVPGDLELAPSLFAALDEPLVHIMRNAADHGIEMEAIRLLRGKPAAGRIQLSFSAVEGGFEVAVSDDGDGIDGDKIAEKAISKGLATAGALASLDVQGRKELVFLPGLSCRDHATEISGMGVGMDAVAVWARTRGISISLDSQAGKGTCVTLGLPAGFVENA